MTTLRPNIDGAQIKSVVERIEKLSEEIAALQSDRRDIYLEAKGNGYSPKIIRMVVQARKQDKAERAEQMELFSLYLDQVGE